MNNVCFIIALKIRAANVPVARSAPATVQIRQTVTENGAHIVQHNGKPKHIFLLIFFPFPS